MISGYQARIGALLVATGLAFALMFEASWIRFAGVVALVMGSLVLAVALEAMLDLDEEPAPEPAVEPQTDRQPHAAA